MLKSLKFVFPNKNLAMIPHCTLFCLPFPVLFSMLFVGCSLGVSAQTTQHLFDIRAATAPDSSKAWLVLTDRIMEGCSKAEIANTDSTLLFVGNISNHNKAGLAQLISPRFDDSLLRYTGLVIHLRGDSSNFVFALHPDLLSAAAKHLEYRLIAPTDWQTLHIPFTKFYSAYFDVELVEKPLDLRTVHYFSIINAYQEGHFSLEIDNISLY